jgi:hypothetical protein
MRGLRARHTMESVLFDQRIALAIRTTLLFEKKSGPSSYRPTRLFSITLGQKLIFAPSCTMRGSRAPVTWPKAAEPNEVFSVV